MIEKNIAPPEKIERSNRMTEEIKSMTDGDSVEVDLKTAKAFRSFAAYHGWKVAQKFTKPGFVRIWRLG
jgi:hypothetical protein